MTTNNTIWNALGVLAAIALLGLIMWLMLYIVQTAFGYFGYDFTYWQVFVIGLACSLLFKSHAYKVES